MPKGIATFLTTFIRLKRALIEIGEPGLGGLGLGKEAGAVGEVVNVDELLRGFPVKDQTAVFDRKEEQPILVITLVFENKTVVLNLPETMTYITAESAFVIRK